MSRKKGYKLSEDAKDKIRKSRIGKMASEETRKKISMSNKGRIAWNLGIKGIFHHTEETKNRIADKQRGEKGHNWKGGKKPINELIRTSTKMKLWRKSVFERDNYTCRNCGIRGTYLEAHHIKSFAYFPELRFDINNGLTLCRECHNKTKISYRKLIKQK